MLPPDEPSYFREDARLVLVLLSVALCCNESQVGHRTERVARFEHGLGRGTTLPALMAEGVMLPDLFYGTDLLVDERFEVIQLGLIKAKIDS